MKEFGSPPKSNRFLTGALLHLSTKFHQNAIVIF